MTEGEQGVGDRLVGVAAWGSLIAVAVGISLQNIRTFDYWWHLRTGQLIAETGAVPTVDPYTFTVPGAPWVDIHWLHQLGLYGIHALGGHSAVVFAKLASVLLLLAVLAPVGARRQRPLVSVVSLGLLLVVAADRIMPRPELPTFLCLAAVIALLDRFARKPDRFVYAIVAVQLVWVNVHGLFALGIAVCAMVLVAELLQPLLTPGASIERPRVRRLAGVIAASLAVSFLNPNGLDGVLYPVQQLGMIGPPDDRGAFGSLIVELIPPLGPGRTMGKVAIALFGSLAALSFAAMAANWRHLRGEDPLLFVSFLYLALGAQRNMALFAIVAAPILVRNWNAVLDRREAPRPRGVAGRAVAGVVSVALLAVAADAARGTFFERIGSMREPGLGVTSSLFPAGAVDWIEKNRPPGPICHHMADGGYLIWRLHPDYPVMTDGRLEVFGEEKFVSLQVPGPGRFHELDREYGFGAMLVHYSLVDSDELIWWLYLNSNWQLVHVDEVAMLFVRLQADDPGRYAEIDVDDPDLFGPLGEPGSVDRRRRFARTHFYMSVRRHAAALALWKETVALYPDLPQGDVVLATLLHRNGFASAAEAILRRLLEEDPDDAGRHVQVGDLRFEAGDLDAARDLYDAALRIDRDLPYALFRRGRLAEAEDDPAEAVRLYLRLLVNANPAEPMALATRRRLAALGVVIPEGSG